MVALTLTVAEQEIVKLVLEFLEARGLHISQVSLERETGLINGLYSEDTLFLRQLIIDGQWDSALDFVEPLRTLPEFQLGIFRYLILKYKYYELLCIKQEPGPMQNNEFTVEELVEVLKDLENFCPSQEEYRSLCALLTLPKLSDHVEFKNWNPSSARVECFQKVYPLVKKYLPQDKSMLNVSMSGSQISGPMGAALNDRLLQLAVKGLFYESCVDYCQSKAVRDKDCTSVKIPSLLEGRSKLSANDVSLISWLESLNLDQFSLPFEQKSLDLKVDSLRKPALDAQWTEQILVTPIKPQMFPHAAVPSAKLKSAEQMSRSLLPQIDGLAYGLNNPMTSSLSVGQRFSGSGGQMMSQSVAPGFQITPSVGSRGQAAQAAMQQSQIDFLFETSDLTRSSMGAPSGLPPEGHPSGPPAAPMAPTAHLPPPSEMSPREQLEEIRRRSMGVNGPGSAYQQPQGVYGHGPLPPVMEAGGGKLYHEFANSRQRMMGQSMMRGHSEPPMGGNYAQPQAMDGVTYQMMQMSMYQPTMAPIPSSSPMGTPQHRQQTPNSQPVMMSQGGGGRPVSVAPGTQSPLAQGGEYQRPVSTPSMGLQERGQTMSPAADYAPAGAARKPQYAVPQQQNLQNGQIAGPSSIGGSSKNVQFVPVCRIEDSQAIRAVSFHPSGRYFAVGTNSKQLHVCKYPEVKRIREDQGTRAAEVLLTRPKQHRGSVYCAGFNPTGELLATGSNDKSVRLMGFNADSCKIGAEFELTMHDGTVRDLVFMEDTSNRTSLLISGGAGNCHIYLTDCATGQGLRALQGHSAPILGLYTWGGCMFVSCSQDKTIRFWDLRCAQAVNLIAPSNKTLSSPVTSVAIDPGGRLLVSGHEDASVMLYDLTASKVIQLFRPHGDEVRAVRFSPGTYYLLSGSYDKKVVITDMRGDLMAPLMYLPVAEHHDKVIQCRWHPHDFSFLSTSADRSAILWALPPPSGGSN